MKGDIGLKVMVTDEKYWLFSVLSVNSVAN